MKRLMALGLVASLSLSVILGGCAGKEVSETPSDSGTKVADTKKEDTKVADGASVDELITLRMMWWGSQNRHDRTLEAIALFEEQNSNIKIEPEFSGWSGYWEKIAAQTAANALPDILQQDYKYLNQYGEKGLLEDLYQHVGDTLNLDDVPQANYMGGDFDGKLYGLCIGMNALSIAYNERLFQETGIDVPQPDWTYSDFYEAGKKINEKTGAYGIGKLMGDSYDGLNYRARQEGFSFYTPDNKELAVTKELLIDFFKRELEVKESGIGLPADAATEKRSVEEKYVATGEAGMEWIWSNQIIAVQSATEDSIKMVIPPKGENQKENGLYIKPGQFLSVASASNHKKEAVSFLDFFTNSVDANKILLAERGVPISTKVSEALKPLLEPSQVVMFDYLATASNHASPISKPEPSVHGEIAKTLENIYQQTMFKQITPEEAADQFFAEAEKLFKK